MPRILGKLALGVKAFLPLCSGNFLHNGLMSHILAANLKRLMADSELYRSQVALGKAADVDQRTIGRILNEEHSPTLDKLEAIAGVFGLQPWQLLVPNLDPKNLPICDMTQEETALYKKLRGLVTSLHTQ